MLQIICFQLVVLTWAVCALNKNTFSGLLLSGLAAVFGWMALAQGAAMTPIGY